MHCVGGDRFVQWIGEIEPYGVRAGSKSDYNHGLSAAINEVPWRVVDGDVNMPHSRRHLHRPLAEDGQNANIFRTVLNEYHSARKRVRERGVYNKDRFWFILNGEQRRRRPPRAINFGIMHSSGHSAFHRVLGLRTCPLDTVLQKLPRLPACRPSYVSMGGTAVAHGRFGPRLRSLRQ